MRDYVIMTDSCCDLSAQMAQEMGLVVLPLSVMQDGKEYKNYLDHRELDPKVFYGKLRAGSLGSTSAANAESFRELLHRRVPPFRCMFLWHDCTTKRPAVK